RGTTGRRPAAGNGTRSDTVDLAGMATAPPPRRSVACWSRPGTPGGSPGRRATGRAAARPPSGRRTRRCRTAGCANSSSPPASARFFYPLAHALVRDGLHQLQLDQPVGQQPQRPAPAPFGGGGAGQGNEVRLEFAVDLAWRARHPLGTQGGVEAL